MGIDVFNPVGSATANIDRKNRLSDVLTNYRFHVMDVSFSVPTVFNLSYGFRFASAPEITAEVKEIKEGVFEYPKKVITGGKVSDITFHRGVQFFDSDFFDWIITAIAAKGAGAISSAIGLGNIEYRKNLLLIQYSDISTGANSLGGSPAALTFQSVTDLVSFVPARAWMLYECLPVSYKAGTDFDAIGADMSISELVVSPKFVEEYSTGL